MQEILGYSNYFVSKDGVVFSKKTNKHLKPRITKLGYARVALYNNNKPKDFSVHRLVAQAFIPNPENKPCINHINGIKTDNRVENLEWCTYSENTLHGYRTGLITISDKCKIVRSKMNKNNFLGGNPMAKKVFDSKTNKIYNSLKECYGIYGYGYDHMSRMLIGKKENKTSMSYVY